MPLNRIATRSLIGLIYLAVAVIAIDQALILLANLMPLNPVAASWRFGAVGLTAGRATPMVLADILLICTATLLEQRGVLRTLGVLHFVAAFVLLAVLAMFSLDTLQVRGMMAPETRMSIVLGAGRVGVLLVTLVAYASWLGWRLWHLTVQARVSGEGARPLVVGRPLDEGA